MKVKFIWFFVLISLVGISCRKMEDHEFEAWVKNPDNGLRVKSVVGEYQIEIQYLPLKYRSGVTSQSSKEQSGFSGVQLILQLGSDQGDLIEAPYLTQEQMAQRDYYFSYRFQNDIFLEYKGVRTECIMAHMEKKINNRGQRTFHVAFEPSNLIDGDFIFSIESSQISNVPLRFKIRNSNLPNVTL